MHVRMYVIMVHTQMNASNLYVIYLNDVQMIAVLEMDMVCYACHILCIKKGKVTYPLLRVLC